MEAFLANITDLGLSQIYISAAKLAAVRTWFDPKSAETYPPLSVRDFGDGRLRLTDGHTRAFCAWQSGVQKIPVAIDEDEIVTCDLGQRLYREDIRWCRRFGLRSVADLHGRVLSEADYARLWERRCDRSHALLTAETHDFPLQIGNCFLYGASDDLTAAYYELPSGALFVLKNGVLLPEE